MVVLLPGLLVLGSTGPVLLVASPEELPAVVPVPVVGSGPVLGPTVVGTLVVLLPEELDVVVSPASPPLQAKRVRARQPRRTL